MAYIPAPTGAVVSVGNTFLDRAVNALETVVGEWESTLRYSGTTVALGVDPLTATGVFRFEYSMFPPSDADGKSSNITVPTEVISGFIIPIGLRPVAQSFRVRYENGPTSTVLDLSTLYHYVAPEQLTRILGQTGLKDTEPVINVRAVLAGKRPNNEYANVPITEDNRLTVQVADVVVPVTTSEIRPTTATVNRAAVTTTSAMLLAANANRRGAIIHNEAGVLFVKLGAGASTTSYSYRLGADQALFLPFPVYTGQIDAIKQSGSTFAQVTETA